MTLKSTLRAPNCTTETYTLHHRHFRKLSLVHLQHLRQTPWILWKDHIPKYGSLELRRANMSSIEATQQLPTPLDWTHHPYEWQRTPKGCVLWGISQMEMSLLWITAAIQKCSQTTHVGYTHRHRHLGGSCTRLTTVEAGHSQRKEPYWRKDITNMPTWSQSLAFLMLLHIPFSVSTVAEALQFRSD